MPYIDKAHRKEWAEVLKPLLMRIESDNPSEGELNYLITRIVHEWIAAHGVSYKTYNAAVGVLGCAQQELYRRKVAPYEDEKIASPNHGDV